MLFSEYGALLFSNQAPFSRNPKKDVDIVYQTWFADTCRLTGMLQAGDRGLQRID